jgi:hypothetical protein
VTAAGGSAETQTAWAFFAWTSSIISPASVLWEAAEAQ